MRFLAAWTLSLIAVFALDQDLDHGHQRAHLVQAVDSWGDEVSHRPSPRHAPKAHDAAIKREMRHKAKDGKPPTRDAKAKRGPIAAAEVSATTKLIPATSTGPMPSTATLRLRPPRTFL
mmetsp:Transcript_28622/g.68098  ORF Transcript_28622/g.68098 Transcript_28622/m.68098 type:complete len:119 (-) Transcript_28622:1512-1868(-)